MELAGGVRWSQNEDATNEWSSVEFSRSKYKENEEEEEEGDK